MQQKQFFKNNWQFRAYDPPLILKSADPNAHIRVHYIWYRTKDIQASASVTKVSIFICGDPDFVRTIANTKYGFFRLETYTVQYHYKNVVEVKELAANNLHPSNI